jgi:spore coat protein U-like protein
VIDSGFALIYECLVGLPGAICDGFHIPLRLNNPSSRPIQTPVSVSANRVVWRASWTWWVATAAFGSGALAAGSSPTRSGTTEFTVSATVIDNCTISSRGIAFGAYDSSRNIAATAEGSIIAKCTRGDAVSVALNQGLSPGLGSTPVTPVRRMTSGSQYLPYHIYIAPLPNKQEWGAGAPGKNQPVAQVAAAVGSPLVFTTYALLPAGTNVRAGEYVDIVTATVTF